MPKVTQSARGRARLLLHSLRWDLDPGKEQPEGGRGMLQTGEAARAETMGPSEWPEWSKTV